MAEGVAASTTDGQRPTRTDVELEFAHLLDPVRATYPGATGGPEEHAAEASWGDALLLEAADGDVGEAETGPTPAPVSRFAAAGLDDDLLPLRGRRR